METLLLTGGAVYIGSHACVQFLAAGYQLVVLDNLSNASKVALERVVHISGQTVTFIEGDIRDATLLERLFAEHTINAVVHFSGLKAVGESVAEPLRHYHNNVYGTMVLLQAMQAAGVHRLVFSSSATVYGEPKQMPIAETCPVGEPTNSYGRSKLMIEQMLGDLCRADTRWQLASLRYFNPVGAHPSGLIGEDPNDIPNNLLPFISQVAVGKLPQLQVYGDDYPTIDGTGVRDYIHVLDLVDGHVAALRALAPGLQVWNLGTGQGVSVLEMIRAFEAASGRKVPYVVVNRRPGDIAICYADATKAQAELGWCAQRALPEMMASAWRWQHQNPNGYRD